MSRTGRPRADARAGSGLCAALALCGALGAAACGGAGDRALVSRTQTFAELRAIKRGVSVTLPGESPRPPYPRERLCDGERVELQAGALAWLRRDAGTTLLIAGPASLVLRKDTLVLKHGKLFVDTPSEATTELSTPHAALHLRAVRASLDLSQSGDLGVYVLRGAVRSDRGAQAGPGERLSIGTSGKATSVPVKAWEDWTGGLATMDRAASPAPFGVGTVGARPPGQQGRAHFPLSIGRMDVRVRIDGDFAETEVDQTFENPSNETVEGIYRFRTPVGATLQRFGVDRNGTLVWGQVKERRAAAAQYQANVYAGSNEDPALLEWESRGVYQARLYPIAAHTSRRVVTRYAEWLGRHGEHAERRLYVYPMAAQGAEHSLPRIEELSVRVELARAAASEVRAGMQAKQIGNTLHWKAYDLVPRADLAVELFDAGQKQLTAYRVPHRIDRAHTAPEALPALEQAAANEAAYLLVPVRPTRVSEPSGGLDLAIVVDTSAATEPSALAIARATTTALLAQLGPQDRAAVWAGDSMLQPTAAGSDKFSACDQKRREAIVSGLAQVERGGATDLGAILAEAASHLEPNRRGALVYIGDGQPTVGELAVPELRERLQRLPRLPRLFAIGIGDDANLVLLNGIAHGGFALRVSDAYAAAEAALSVLETAETPAWLGATVEFGANVDRVLPRVLGALPAGDSSLVLARCAGEPPKQITLKSGASEQVLALQTKTLEDNGDLQRRWAEARLVQLLDEGAGRAALVEIGMRSGIITPFTSWYVPTRSETAVEQQASAEPTRRRPAREPWLHWLFPGLREAEPQEVAEEETPQALDEGARAANAGAKPQPTSEAAATRNRYGVEREVAARAAAPPTAAAEVAGEPIRPEAKQMRRYARQDSGNVDELSDAAAYMAGGGSGYGSGAGGLGTLGLGLGSARIAGVAHKQVIAEAKAKRAKSVDGPAAKPASQAAAPPIPELTLAAIGHAALACGPAADMPLAERRLLWIERLNSTQNDEEALASIYKDALAACELPTWIERRQLLLLSLDRIGEVSARVAFWRRFASNPVASELLYRAILTRVHTANELHALHSALGLRQLEPQLLAKALAEKSSVRERALLLRELFAQYSEDLELGLRLLEAYEDAADSGNGRALARRLRQRSDATTRVRTAVGEYYLRLAAQPAIETAQRDQSEARRTFGEIVEFSPDDPVARRLLGDLLRAHGWYAEALRQYETLAKLTPDDSSVRLLMAAAAQGLGRTEEAVRWTEQAGAADAQFELAKSSRCLASVFLAWARSDALRAGRTAEADRLRERARRLAGKAGAGTLRLILTWSHPELRPEFWSNALGSSMPANDANPLLGVAQARLPLSKSDGFVEIHLQPEDAQRAARLGAGAVLTAIADEGQDKEQVVQLPISFQRREGAALEQRRFVFEHGGLREVTL